MSTKPTHEQAQLHMEGAAKRFEVWMESRSPGHIAAMRQFMTQMSAQLAAGAKA